MTYGNFSIYALIDPDTEQTFYIGRSKNVKTRFKSHKQETQKNIIKKQHPLSILFDIPIDWKSDDVAEGNREKQLWIHDILKRGKQPIVKILDEWYADTESNANKLEAAWIAHYLLMGQPLQNKILSDRMKPSWYKTSPIDYIGSIKNKH